MSERTSPGRQPYVTPADGGAELHRKIDRAYDKAEVFVAGIGRILGVDTRSSVPDPGPDPVPALPPPSSRALPAATGERSNEGTIDRSFEIVEVIKDGKAIGWTVTNGRESMCCASREIAQAVLDHVQKATAQP